MVQRYKYSFPGNRFDSEALFVREGRLWIVSKPRQGPSVVYRLDANGGAKYKLTPVATLNFGRATGADLSPDGKRLMICTGRMVYVFAVDQAGVPLVDVPAAQVRHPGGEFEACCFDGADAVVISEAGEIYRISAADLEAGTRFLRPEYLHKRSRPRPK